MLTKKEIQRASADVGLIFIAYNLRRLLTIVGKDRLIAYLKGILASFWAFLLLQKLKGNYIDQKIGRRNKKSIFGNIDLFSLDFGFIYHIKLGF